MRSVDFVFALIEPPGRSLKVEQMRGFEPPYPVWKTGVLPLNYTCRLRSVGLLRSAVALAVPLLIGCFHSRVIFRGHTLDSEESVFFGAVFVCRLVFDFFPIVGCDLFSDNCLHIMYFHAAGAEFTLVLDNIHFGFSFKVSCEMPLSAQSDQIPLAWLAQPVFSLTR